MEKIICLLDLRFKYITVAIDEAEYLETTMIKRFQETLLTYEENTQRRNRSLRKYSRCN